MSSESAVWLAEAALDVLAGPSQCQWSPCGSQPVDSVGLGMIVAAVVEAVVESVVVASVVVDETEDEAVDAGPSQCLEE